MEIEQLETPEFPEVIDLNVGGRHFTTSLSTLTKYPDSTLAAMFNGEHPVLQDKNGRYFIDMDGDDFNLILQFLRYRIIPPAETAVHILKCADYFDLRELKSILSETLPVKRIKYFENVRKFYSQYEAKRRSLRENLKQAKSSSAVIVFHWTDWKCANHNWIYELKPYTVTNDGALVYHYNDANWVIEVDISPTSEDQAEQVATTLIHDLKKDGVYPLEGKADRKCNCSITRNVKVVM